MENSLRVLRAERGWSQAGLGERIGVLPAITTWEYAVVIMVIYLTASSSITIRNGAG